MEKSPHYNLSIVIELIGSGKVRSTKSALAGGETLGFDYAQMLEVMLALTAKDFYKSMTTYADNKIWQDVYRQCPYASSDIRQLLVQQKFL